MELGELAQKLLEHPQFVMLLKESVGQLVQQVQMERRQAADTPEVNSLIQDLYHLVKQAVELTLKAQTSGFTESLIDAFNRMKTQMEKQFQMFKQTYKTEMGVIETDCRRALKSMKNELIEDRLRVQKKIAAAKQSIESLVTKVKNVEDAQTTIVESRSMTCIGLSNQRSIDQNVNITAMSGEKVDEISKKVASLEDSLSIAQNQIQDKYQATIRGLWNVVTDVSTRLAAIEAKSVPEQKPKKDPKVRKSMWKFL